MRWILDALSTMPKNGWRKEWGKNGANRQTFAMLSISLSLSAIPFQMLQTIYFLLTQITWLFRSRECACALFYEYFNDNSDVSHINWIHVQVKVKFIHITKHPLCWCSSSLSYIIAIYLLHIIANDERSSSGRKRIFAFIWNDEIFQFWPQQSIRLHCLLLENGQN